MSIAPKFNKPIIMIQVTKQKKSKQMKTPNTSVMPTQTADKDLGTCGGIASTRANLAPRQATLPADLPKPAQIGLAFGVQDLRGFRAIASAVLARYASEWRRDHTFNPGLDNAKRIASHFKLADYYNCLLNA